MRHLLLLPLLLLPTCWETEPPPDIIEYGEPFTLAWGESGVVGEEGLEVEFQDVLNDSRCPLDVDCFWEGRARIQLLLVDSGWDSIYLEPFIYGYVSGKDTAAHKSVFSERYRVTLLQLDPYPSSETGRLQPRDYTALLAVALNPIPLQSDRLNLFAHDLFEQYFNNPIDGFFIDSTSMEADTLRIDVRYGGGCKQHDFYLFGSTAWEEKVPPVMPAVIIHDGHWDLCKAWLHRNLRFDLSPIREWQGSGGAVVIQVKDAPDSVIYYY
ncbi:MAG: hypothetical protein ACETWG_08900 [Candidatus Neomarinimicrobiota bacterium]